MTSTLQKESTTLQQLPLTEDPRELERFILFAIAVAGKTAKQIDKALTAFLALEPYGETPFEKLRIMRLCKRLLRNLKRSSLGQHHKLSQAYRELLDAVDHGGLDLRTCTPAELEQIHGIGPKTSRFFILHSRPNQRYAVLDTHILKFLASLGIDVPKATPSGRRYRELELEFLKLADKLAISPAELDAAIWYKYARK